MSRFSNSSNSFCIINSESEICDCKICKVIEKTMQSEHRLVRVGSSLPIPKNDTIINTNPKLSTVTVSVYLKRETLPASIDLVKRFANEYKLSASVDPPNRLGQSSRVALTGTKENIEEAFGVQLFLVRAVDSTGFITEYISHDTNISLPAYVSPSVTAVLGLDNRPIVGR
jgi:hypothetical protein